ncbi:hypothetical protein BGHDH14_bgh04608 [Blumeria hordei DH14]|uniref:Uncharacterized protein n=1 Tax=Blumeria graminis f. sp. hordei (strain DH14) TaxID=546991 RepID=N1J5K0_BLUG1|nr:hypothetical protein BGHDH14_bgh04608 [Blumeria hordei DH14]
MSSTSVRNSSKALDSPDRTGNRETGFGMRAKIAIGDNDRLHDSRSKVLRSRRNEVDLDSEEWVSPQSRRSIGADASDRFSGRMGGDKNREEKFHKDREDHDRKERPRGFDFFSRDKTSDHQERERERNHRNTPTSHGRNETSWFKERDTHEISKDRQNVNEKLADRSRGWRGREKDEKVDKAEKNGEKSIEGTDRPDRRWDRGKSQHHDHDPEWMEEPAEEKGQVHTLADFEKWKEQMQGKTKSGKTPIDDLKMSAGPSLHETDKPKIEATLDFDSGPDKFLSLFTPKEDHSHETLIEAGSEGVARSKTTGKASRFTSFFAAQEDPSKAMNESLSTTQTQSPGKMEVSSGTNAQSNAEKEAFQQLLQKLQRQTIQASSSNTTTNMPLKNNPLVSERVVSNNVHPPEYFQQFHSERQDDCRHGIRSPPQPCSDQLSQRQLATNQPMMRPEQMLQELVGQRQNALNQSSRMDQQPPRNTNAEFLMGLMQNVKNVPNPQRPDQVLHRMSHKPDNRQQLPRAVDCEPDMQRNGSAQRDRSASERQARSNVPPGFFEDSNFHRSSLPPLDRQPGNPQPGQLIQRPGLEMVWEQQAQLPPSQHRMAQSIAPPPGLSNSLNRSIPMPQQMYPPGFPIGSYPPPDIVNLPARTVQMQPPPGFFNGPPPGLLPPGLGGYQGPEAMNFGATPFDSRGPLPQGAFRRQ